MKKEFKIEQCPSTLKLCLACLLSFVEQASWAELEREGALSYLKNFYFLKSLQKIVQNINHPAKYDNFL